MVVLCSSLKGRAQGLQPLPGPWQTRLVHTWQDAAPAQEHTLHRRRCSDMAEGNRLTAGVRLPAP